MPPRRVVTVCERQTGVKSYVAVSHGAVPTQPQVWAVAHKIHSRLRVYSRARSRGCNVQIPSKDVELYVVTMLHEKTKVIKAPKASLLIIVQPGGEILPVCVGLM